MKPVLRQAEMVRRRLLETWSDPLISTPDLYQRGPNAIRCQKTASEMLAVLEEHGHLRRVPGPAVVAGRQRRELWRIVGKELV